MLWVASDCVLKSVLTLRLPMSQFSPADERVWHFADTRWVLGTFPRFMGILNVTPDSFSDGGRWAEVDLAVEQGLLLAEQGADIIDIGGESTRPGAAEVSEEEEMRRVIPVIQQLAARINVPISIDTMKAGVARAALDAGARIVNDVSALTFDPRLAELCAGSDCGVILMHMLGNPRTMQQEPRYDNAVNEIRDYLAARVRDLEQRGIAAERMLVDPGIGFGKTPQHNLEILANIAQFRSFGRPVLIGHSRKRFLAKLVGRPVEERLAGTIGVAVALAQQHCDLIRVHDVAAVRDAVTAWRRVVDG